MCFGHKDTLRAPSSNNSKNNVNDQSVLQNLASLFADMFVDAETVTSDVRIVFIIFSVIRRD
jgi:hypothetical protein